MALFENFPYVNLHELNLDWVMKIIKDFNEKYPGFIEELENKISKPEQDPDGRYGYILRSLGNGKTEWTDFTPIDEQIITEAVYEWLNDHPEATTTVEDNSLTIQKFTNTLKNQTKNDYVTPEMFGAIGDGIADDTNALQDCIDYAIENNIAMHLLNSKTYGISEGLRISGGWLDMIKSTGVIKALIPITVTPMITITSPNIITDRSEIGKRYNLTFNIDGNNSTIGIYGHGMFEYIVSETLIRNTQVGIRMDSPGAEVIFTKCYIDGTAFNNSVGVINNASDNVYDQCYMYNCHTAFEVNAFCELNQVHPWMDRNIPGSIGIQMTAVCKITNSYIDTYQISFKKTNGANLIMTDTYIHISSEFYDPVYGTATIFWAQNNDDYSYSILNHLFIYVGGAGTITCVLSNLATFNIPMPNTRIEPGVDVTMRTTTKGYYTDTTPISSAAENVRIAEQNLVGNDYAEYWNFFVRIDDAFNAWSTIANTTNHKPAYGAILIGMNSSTGTSHPFYLNPDGTIVTSINLAQGSAYRLTGIVLKK